MKRFCGKCRSLSLSTCCLGYKTKTIRKETFLGPLIEIKPLENCPKPLTYNEFFKFLNEYNLKKELINTKH